MYYSNNKSQNEFFYAVLRPLMDKFMDCSNKGFELTFDDLLPAEKDEFLYKFLNYCAIEPGEEFSFINEASDEDRNDIFRDLSSYFTYKSLGSPLSSEQACFTLDSIKNLAMKYYKDTISEMLSEHVELRIDENISDNYEEAGYSRTQDNTTGEWIWTM